MKTKFQYKTTRTLTFLIILLMILVLAKCTNSRKISDQGNSTTELINTNLDSTGIGVELHFIKGESFNHPLMVVWIENMQGEYIQTLFIAKSLGSGVFNYGDKSEGKWKPGEIRRPAALPYWAHKRGVIEKDGLFVPTSETPMPDAITSATPKNDFILKSKATELKEKKFRLLFEINQTWDWNEYWTNDRYLDDPGYKTSCQPSLVYAVDINIENLKVNYKLEPIGHGHYSGKTGELFPDMSTLTTALNIVNEITAKINLN